LAWWFWRNFLPDHWNVVLRDGDAEIDKTNIIELLLSAINENIDIKENLYTFDGKSGYSLGQGNNH
jgi:isocitrate dehydrogenase